MNERTTSAPCLSCRAMNVPHRLHCWRCGNCLSPGHHLDSNGQVQPNTTPQEIKRLLAQADTVAPPPRFFWARFLKRSD